MVAIRSARFAGVALALALAACGSRGSVVVVDVEATPAISGVAKVHATVTALGATRNLDKVPPSSISTPFTFEIDMPPSASGAISVHVDLSGASGASLGSGDGSGTITPSGNADVIVAIRGGPCAHDTDCTNGGIAPCGGKCSASNVCTYADTTVNCGAAACAGAPPMVTGASSCNGAGSCITPPPTACNAPQYAMPMCSGATCDFTCNTGFTRFNTSCLLTWSVETPPVGTPTLEAVFAVSPTDVYAVGDTGTILHSTGNGTWTAQTSNTSAYLNSGYGYTGGGFYDAYAVGSGGTIMHNAAIPPSVNWQAETSNTVNVLSGIWGVGAGDLYAVGRGNTIRHTVDKGASWMTETTNAPTSNLLAVWGSSTTDLYAVGYLTGTPNKPVILHSTGSGSWSSQSLPTNSATALHSVWGSGAADVYAAGDQGVILHSTGNGAWTVESSNQPGGTFVGWGWDSMTIYAVGFTSSNPTGVLLYSQGSGAWGTPLTDTTLVSTLKNNTPLGITGTGPSDVYIVGSGPVLHGR